VSSPEYPAPLASIGHRLGGKAVDFALSLVTLNIGWLIWSFVVWGNGQTPGKQLLKMRVYDKTTGKPVKWGHMAIREFGLQTTLFLIILVAYWALYSFATFRTYGFEEITDPGIDVSWLFVNFIRVISIGLLSLFIVDLFWIFRRGKKNRLTDVILKTDVLNESPNPR